MPVKITGWMNRPFFSAGSDGMALQTCAVAPGVLVPSSMKPRTLSS